MADILPPSNYDAIRAALDVSLTEKNLRNEIIGQEIYAPAAKADVIERVSDAESKTGTDLERVRRAAILFCAARLAPAVVRITSVNIQTRDASYSRRTFDPEKRAEELRGLAEQELAEVIDSTTAETAHKPTMFTVAAGTRGKL